MLFLCMGHTCVGFRVTRAVGKERSGLEGARVFRAAPPARPQESSTCITQERPLLAGWGDNVCCKGEGVTCLALVGPRLGEIGLTRDFGFQLVGLFCSLFT